MASAALALASSASVDPGCEKLLPPVPLPAPAQRRALRAEDLVALRDIGEPTDRVDLPSPLGVSPDGRRAAFLLRQARPQENRYCLGVVLVDLAVGAPTHLLDTGGDLIRERHVRNGLEAPETGLPALITPVWSPDGRMLAYLKRTAANVQAWVADTNGVPRPRQVTNTPFDVESIEWSNDGKGLIFTARPALVDAEAAITREGKSGYLFDDRFRPMASKRPFVPGPVPRRTYFADLTTTHIRAIDDIERTATAPVAPPRSSMGKVGTAGAQAWTEGSPGSPGALGETLHAQIKGRQFICSAPECRGQIIDLWQSPNPGVYFYLRREGTSGGILAFYAWGPGEAPKRLWQTTNLLVGCKPTGRHLACLEEGPDFPRRLVLLTPGTGATRTLFEPNPELRTVQLGRVTRLEWTSAQGVPGFGHLVTPPGYQPGQKHPLVVVQYTSRGFLRGGTGDEYPIQLFAARGIAVLSVQYPPDLTASVSLSSGDGNSEPRDWPWRRRVQSSLEAGIRRAIASGIIDAARIGITGLSDGSTSVAWALANTRIFAAAAISSCCLDEGSILTGGPRLARSFAQDGYPVTNRDRPWLWQGISLAANAQRAPVPLLMQLSDDEYDHSFEAYYALKARNWPVEMFVFPGERHIKWQPSHRLAIYERSVDWFDFWLNDRENTPDNKSEQYERWREMRGARDKQAALQSSHERAQVSTSTNASRR